MKKTTGCKIVTKYVTNLVLDKVGAALKKGYIFCVNSSGAVKVDNARMM